MKYTGRITIAITTIAIFFILRVYAYVYWDYPLTKPPIFVFICLFITWQLGKQYDKVKFHSERDSLTKLYNRRFINEIFPILIAQMDRQNKKLSIFILDCNKFKTINDQFGHNLGDLVLKEFSTLLCATVRKNDIVSRWGGDEFLIIAPYSDDKSILKMVDRLNNDLQKLSQKLQLDISFSYGYAVYPRDAQSMEELVRIADERMYKEKGTQYPNHQVP